MTTYYHGGYPSLRVGEWVLPPSRTDSPSLSPEIRNYRPDRVYVTTDEHLAACFALYWRWNDSFRRRVPVGAVYTVDPARPLEPDVDMRAGSEFTTSHARVRAIVLTFADSARQTIEGVREAIINRGDDSAYLSIVSDQLSMRGLFHD